MILRRNLLFLLPVVLAACGGPSTESDGLMCGAGTHQEGRECVADSPTTGGAGDAQTGGGTAGGAMGGSETSGGTGGSNASGATGGTGGSSAGTGATPASGGSGGTGPTGGTAGSLPTGGIGGTFVTGGTGGVSLPTLGDPCSPPGALTCASTSSKLSLICGTSGLLEANETCEGDLFCYQWSGANHGSCQPCPGAAYCGPSPVDEPCPDPSQLYVDCSGHCGGGIAPCDPGCGVVTAQLPSDLAEFDTIVVRTPARPGEDGCSCGVSGAPAYVLVIDALSGKDTEYSASIAIPEPWKRDYLGEEEDVCAFADPDSSSCFYIKTGPGPEAYLGTFDPEAPAVNVILSHTNYCF